MTCQPGRAWLRLAQLALCAGLACAASLISGACSSLPPGAGVGPDGRIYEPLGPEFRRDGLISSNTYQVHITVYAETEEEALERGRALARAKAANLMLQEPILNLMIGENGKREIRRLAEGGDVVRVHPEGRDTWIVVLQVYRQGLRDYLRRLY